MAVPVVKTNVSPVGLVAERYSTDSAAFQTATEAIPATTFAGNVTVADVTVLPPPVSSLILNLPVSVALSPGAMVIVELFVLASIILVVAAGAIFISTAIALHAALFDHVTV